MSHCALVGGASTQSRGRRPLPPGVIRGETLSVSGVRERVRFTKANGSTYDTELLSWVGGQSGVLFGQPDPLTTPEPIWKAIMQSAADVHGSYGHRAEYQLADELGAVFDGLLMSNSLAARFFLNGGDACAAAIRCARAVTGYAAIATQGYHGATDSLAHDPASNGVPVELLRLHHRFEWGDVAAMKRAAADAACIMVEVPAVDDDSARAFLRECREHATYLEIPFIIDDVVLGFRLALGGSAEYYGVKPDVVVLGKAMSAIGGVSAVIGDEKIVGTLANEVFYSTTFGGHPFLCGVAAETVRWLRENKNKTYGTPDNIGGDKERGWAIPGRYGHLRRIGNALQDGLNTLGIKCVGQPERSALQFPNDAEWLAFCSRMIERGIMIHRPQFPCLSHTTQDVEITLAAARECV